MKKINPHSAIQEHGDSSFALLIILVIVALFSFVRKIRHWSRRKNNWFA